MASQKIVILLGKVIENIFYTTHGPLAPDHITCIHVASFFTSYLKWYAFDALIMT